MAYCFNLSGKISAATMTMTLTAFAANHPRVQFIYFLCAVHACNSGTFWHAGGTVLGRSVSFCGYWIRKNASNHKGSSNLSQQCTILTLLSWWWRCGGPLRFILHMLNRTVKIHQSPKFHPKQASRGWEKAHDGWMDGQMETNP